MNLIGKSRIALYIRCSTDKQSAEGHTIDGQKARLYEYACQNGLQVVECIVDDGVSAKTLLRPGMTRLRELVADGAIDAVVTTKGDRISRSLRDLLNLCAELEDRSVALVTTDEPLDTSTAIGRAMQQVQGVFSQLEREMISARTKEGLAAARAKGIRLGRPPVGHSVIDGKLVPNERYEIVERVHALRAEGFTLQEIADRLGAEGHLTGRGKTRWYPSSVRMYLSAPLREAVA